MFFLHFLYFMDNFCKFLRFYGMFQNVGALMRDFFASNYREINYPKNSFTKHNNLRK